MNEKFAKIRENLFVRNSDDEQEKEILAITLEARKAGKKWRDIVTAFEKEKIFMSTGQLRYRLKKLEQNTIES